MIRSPKTFTSTLLAVLVVAASPAAVATSAQHVAVYDILSPKGEPVGRYEMVLRGPLGPGPAVYESTGRFELSFKTLGLFSYQYLSTDKVVHDGAGIRSFRIDENDKGDVTVVTGERQADGAALRIAEHKGASDASPAVRVLRNTEFDLSLYTFRFPLRCADRPLGEKKNLRVLVPRTGAVERVQSEVVGVDTGNGAPAGTACQIVSRDASGKLLKTDYFAANGTLLYQRGDRFHLKLQGETHDAAR